MPEYSHLLIPDRVDFAPEPQHVGEFLTALVALGAAPLKPVIAIAKPTGEVRTVQNRFSGKIDSIVTRKAIVLAPTLLGC